MTEGLEHLLSDHETQIQISLQLICQEDDFLILLV